MPVLPAVPSTMRPPGLSAPRFSASRMIHSAARSFTDCPGLRNSALPRISQPVASLARRRRMSGVLPMVSRTELATMPATSRASGARATPERLFRRGAHVGEPAVDAGGDREQLVVAAGDGGVGPVDVRPDDQRRKAGDAGALGDGVVAPGLGLQVLGFELVGEILDAEPELVGDLG